MFKIGGSDTPPDDLPSYIVIENLDGRSGRPPFTFTNDGGEQSTHAENAAAIYIESGNRQLDLVDGEDHPSVVNHPRYGQTFVYGNILVEPDGAGNSQSVHYGGDSGTLTDYRKGTLYFFHNTVISTLGGNTVGADPGFVDAPGQDFHLAAGSSCLDGAGPLAAASVPLGGALPGLILALLLWVRRRGSRR